MGLKLFDKALPDSFGGQRPAKTVEFPQGYKQSVNWIPRIGDIFPNFTVDSTHGKINFHDWAEGNWVLLFSHPSIASAVSATEFAALASCQTDFDDRGVKVIGVSCDSTNDHARWQDEIERLFKLRITFPVVEDTDGTLSSAFGAVHPKQGRDFSIRKTFIIDPTLKVKLINEYPINVGRSVEETLRTIDALQIAEYHRLGLPADWEFGQPCTVAPYIDNDQARRAHGKVKVLSRTIRLVDCPTGPPNDDVPAPPPQSISETYRR
jgi:alkyl hydroperoxide reductase subunit AhpC